ncbi:acyl carrier protein [Peptoanaerobacter stomatis]|uniref:Acyl carrier protein n=1 Tax=Peptoanaerobacter stomatis TaxID=796937 RepID=J6HC14_9FIRM|nr:acyl carrier protein [Peptoanaerobacter stomatis]EHL17760.1 acyl carrier protein [Peptoanaerobacter stomatis]EJU20358.1 putative acyl carrier protein [Peptoanaerobacter stomatis]NWO25421.1 acyl carrier protein [Peptostreptococcaceae bacterium oral taxon 081]
MFEQVQEIIAEVLGTDKENIKLESNLTDDLNADSLDALDIATQIEDKLSVKIPDEEFTKFQTVKDIVDYLENNK